MQTDSDIVIMCIDNILINECKQFAVGNGEEPPNIYGQFALNIDIYVDSPSDNSANYFTFYRTYSGFVIVNVLITACTLLCCFVLNFNFRFVGRRHACGWIGTRTIRMAI